MDNTFIPIVDPDGPFGATDILNWIEHRPFLDRTVERALLGLVLHTGRVPPAMRDLQPDCFHDPRHAALWAEILALRDADPRTTVDRIRLLAQLKASGALAPEDRETLDYILTLSDLQPDPDMAPLWVARLLDLHNKRRMCDLAVDWLQQLSENEHTGVTAAELRRTVIAALQSLDFAAPHDAPATWADLQALAGPTIWDWPGWLPRGCLVLLAAASGMGKSLLALRLAACYLRGDPWPDGRPTRSPFAGQAAALWCESEASQFLNLKRARAWGLPCERIWTPLQATQDVQLDRPDHKAAVARLAARPEVRLIVVDSLSGASHVAENTGQTMGIVQWLAELARDTRKPILLLHHLRKGPPRTGAGCVGGAHTVRLEDLRGHSGIVQPARIVLALDAPDPARPQIKRLSVVKSNLAALPPPLGFYTAAACDDAAAGAALSVPQLSFCDPPQPPQGGTLLACAVEHLRDLLAQGPLPVALVHQELAQAGISKRTTHRAKAHLGVRTARQDGRWIWLLPAVDACLCQSTPGAERPPAA